MMKIICNFSYLMVDMIIDHHSEYMFPKGLDDEILMFYLQGFKCIYSYINFIAMLKTNQRRGILKWKGNEQGIFGIILRKKLIKIKNIVSPNCSSYLPIIPLKANETFR